MTQDDDFSPARVADRLEIADLIARFCRSVDRKDWDLTRSLYTDDGYDDHGRIKGTVEEFITWCSARHESIALMMHHITTMVIDFVDTDSALVETYVCGVEVKTFGGDTPDGSAEDGSKPTVGFGFARYVDRVERRGGRWLIARRTLANEFGHIADLRQNPNLPSRDSLPNAGRRDRNDLIFREMAALGIN